MGGRPVGQAHPADTWTPFIPRPPGPRSSLDVPLAEGGCIPAQVPGIVGRQTQQQQLYSGGQFPISSISSRSRCWRGEVGEGRCLGICGLSPSGSAPPEPPHLLPRDKHPEAPFSRPTLHPAADPGPPTLSHLPPTKWRDASPSNPTWGFLGSPRSQAPQPTPPLSHLCPGHHTKGALHSSLQPRVSLQLPQHPSPRSPAFHKEWGAASFPLSLVSLRADKERVGW